MDNHSFCEEMSTIYSLVHFQHSQPHGPLCTYNQSLSTCLFRMLFELSFCLFATVIAKNN